MAYQAIANGGTLMRPYLIQSIDNNGQKTQTQPQVQRQVISAKAAKTLTSMLVSAADYNQQATFPGYSVAVKTGTATTQGIADDQTEASIAGFLPASNPQFVILVKLDRPQGQDNIFGGTAAAPLWKYIGQQLMLHYQIAPDRPGN
jgi:cell division protein FtsI/penicillin-binding protein 2